MTFSLPPLAYALTALEPHISKETLEYHHGKHHATYVTNLNNLLPSGEFEGSSDLVEIIRKAPPGGIFNNAAQIWNHTFYFESLGDTATIAERSDTGALAEAITKKWGSFDDFKIAFTDLSLKTFGSGWVWLVKKPDGTLDIVSTQNAETPITTQNVPLLTCDVWEHAYYIDYRNARAKYLENFWQVIDWKKIEDRLLTK